MIIENVTFDGYDSKVCIVMRGIPGSFKSTMAKYLASRCGLLEESIENNSFYYKDLATNKIVSARHSTDQYHMIDGEYKWKAENAGKYHSMNYKAFRDSCELGISLVICDNTNITTAESKKYVETAKHNGYIVSICAMDIPTLGEAIERNQHNVPKETIHKMRQRLLDTNK